VSAVAYGVPKQRSNDAIPPANRTLPLGKRAAAARARLAWTIGPVADQEFVVGSYRYASVAGGEELKPPASSTLPLPRRVAAGRFPLIPGRLPAEDQLSAAGS